MSSALPNTLPAPFQIGIKPLDPGQWIEVDALLPAYLDEKARLEAVAFPQVFMAEPDSEAAQREVLIRLVDHLLARFPEVYRRAGPAIEILPAGRSVDLADATTPPLQRAARLVQEDLVLMRRGPEHWRLAAASLSFPSSWVLAEKFGRPMHEVHSPVPGFGDGTRNAGLIERMFDNCRPGAPMIRWNWSLFGDDRLFHPEAGHPDRPRFTDGAWLRLERQTFTRLAQSGDLLFTIRIGLRSVESLAAEPQGPAIAATLLRQLEGLDESQLAYKGLLADHTRLRQLLARLAGA